MQGGVNGSLGPRLGPETRFLQFNFYERRLPLDYNELAEFDSVSKSLHAQWERFKIREGVLYRQHWDNSSAVVVMRRR